MYFVAEKNKANSPSSSRYWDNLNSKTALRNLVVFPIYILMVLIDLKTKACPFCAETIQLAAVKCRFCGEFLNTAKARALQENQEPEPELTDEEVESDILFAGRPSLFGMMPGLIKAAIFLFIIHLVIKYPLESMVNNRFGIKLAEQHVALIGYYRVMIGWGIAGMIILGLLVKILNLKMIYYEVNADRIEFSRGILDRRVDNLDMFRVIDLKLRKNIIDCVFGIGTVALETTDKSDPQFVFKKVRHCRDLYDVIKKASLDADRRTGVVHLE